MLQYKTGIDDTDAAWNDTFVHPDSTVVALDNERVLGAQASVGASVQLSVARLGVEYNVARVNSFSLKVGFGR
jgi:hypothetical protein